PFGVTFLWPKLATSSPSRCSRTAMRSATPGGSLGGVGACSRSVRRRRSSIVVFRVLIIVLHLGPHLVGARVWWPYKDVFTDDAARGVAVGEADGGLGRH